MAGQSLRSVNDWVPAKGQENDRQRNSQPIIRSFISLLWGLAVIAAGD